MKRIHRIAAVLALTSLGMASPAPAGSRASAAGNYGFTLTEHCVETPRMPPPAQGYDLESRALLTPANAVTAVLTGKMKLSRSGQVSLFDTFISDLFIDRTQLGDVPIATGVQVACDGTYTRDESALDLEFDCSADVPGGVRVEIGPFFFEGFIGPANLSGVLSSIEGNIQTEAVFVNGARVAERQRACVLSGQFVRIR